MNLGTFACIVSFDLHTGTDNIRDYAGLYTKDPFLALFHPMSLILRRFSEKTLLAEISYIKKMGPNLDS
jgi:hypothetical protein